MKVPVGIAKELGTEYACKRKNAFHRFSPSSWPTLSQLLNFEISGATFLNYINWAVLLILRLKICERADRDFVVGEIVSNVQSNVNHSGWLLFSGAIIANPTSLFSLLGCSDKEIGEFYVVQESSATDFTALNLWKGRPVVNVSKFLYGFFLRIKDFVVVSFWWWRICS